MQRVETVRAQLQWFIGRLVLALDWEWLLLNLLHYELLLRLDLHRRLQWLSWRRIRSCKVHGHFQGAQHRQVDRIWWVRQHPAVLLDQLLWCRVGLMED